MSQVERHGEAEVGFTFEGATCTARITGEIDLANVGSIGRRVLRVTARASRLVLDLSGVTFMDSQALRELASLRLATLAAGRQISIVSGSGTQAEHLLGLTGLDLAMGTTSGAEGDREVMTEGENDHLRAELREERSYPE